MLLTSLYIENESIEEEVKLKASSIILPNKLTLEEGINNKVNKVNGKGLSTFDYTKLNKEKLQSITGELPKTISYTKYFTPKDGISTYSSRFLAYGNVRHYFINMTWSLTSDARYMILGNLDSSIKDILPDKAGIAENAFTNLGTPLYIYVNNDGTIGINAGNNILNRNDGVRVNMVFIKSEF